MTARIIDGRAIAAELRARVATEVQRLKNQHGVEPGQVPARAGVLVAVDGDHRGA